MKTEKDCIIQLRDVPMALVNHKIMERMFLTADAVEEVLNGNMFSSLDVYWHHADIIPEERALKVCNILMRKYKIWAVVIKVH